MATLYIDVADDMKVKIHTIMKFRKTYRTITCSSGYFKISYKYQDHETNLHVEDLIVVSCIMGLVSTMTCFIPIYPTSIQ